MNEQFNLLTTKQVSKILGVHVKTVQRLTKQGKIKGIRIGKLFKYKKSDIDQYFSQGTDFSKEAARKPDGFIENRAYPRINTYLKCHYLINLLPIKAIDGISIIRNLSASGILLINQNKESGKIMAGDPIYLEFKLSSEDAEIKINGRMVRKDKNEQGNFSELGIKFRNISERDRDKIISYVG